MAAETVSPTGSALKGATIVAMCCGAAFFLWMGHARGLFDDVVATILLMGAGIGWVAWPILDDQMLYVPLAPLVAFVGCDGSGKTSLSGDLLAEFVPEMRVSSSYLGLGTGTIGEKLKRLPVLGVMLERKLARKATQARTRGQKIPGLPTALVLYGFSLLRLRRFRKMLEMRQDGIAIITDRYPQVEVPGFYDGPGLSAARPGSSLVARLARHERRLYEWMASFRPDVVIRLNVDAATAFARKPDHKPDLLQQKVDATARLRFSGAPIVDLDARRPYALVRAEAANIVRRTFGQGFKTSVAAGMTVSDAGNLSAGSR